MLSIRQKNLPAEAENLSDGPASEGRLKAVLSDLHHLYPNLIDLSLNRIERFLHQLGEPHLRLPPVIHVAGTNGKGSVVATLRALLEAQGYNCHVMTSPHLVRINERFRLAGNLISSAALADVLEECRDANGGQAITYFEILTAAGFLAFSRMPADFVILETGLGGRLDATNVIPRPAASVITAISMDHKEFLGATIKSIAREKAGIMKPGVPCVLAYQPAASHADVCDTIQSHALSTGAPLFRAGSEWRCEPEGEQMRFTFESDSILLPRPSLVGNHQIGNAGAALAALRVISGVSLDPLKLSTGLCQIAWPGRLQRFTTGPLLQLLRDGWELWIDGGHNDSAGQALAQQARVWQEQGNKPLHLIVAMVSRKDPASFLAPLVPHAESLTLTTIPGEESAFTVKEIYDRVKGLPFRSVLRADTPQGAISAIAQKYPIPGRILISGSLYLVGSILKLPPQ